MRTPMHSKPIAAFLATATLLVLAASASAHHADETVLAVPAAPATTAPIETTAGTLDELIVDNRATGKSTRYVALVQADGQSVTLRGDALNAFTKGTLVEASGRRNGNALFVTNARSLSPAM